MPFHSCPGPLADSSTSNYAHSDSSKAARIKQICGLGCQQVLSWVKFYLKKTRIKIDFIFGLNLGNCIGSQLLNNSMVCGLPSTLLITLPCGRGETATSRETRC